MTQPVLELRRLRAGYGHRRILNDISLSVEAGEIVALLGRNGAGKSTTLLAIAGFIADVEGEILLDGRPLTGPAHQRARAGTGLVIKGRSLFGSLSVADNLRLCDLAPAALLDIFPELEPRLGVAAGQLSGGEQQMVAVARALLRRPRVVLLDELTFGLSPAMARRVVDAVVSQSRNEGIAVLAVEQHIHIAERIATHAAIVADGEVKLHLRRDELLARAHEVEAIYLGHALDV
ncbi:amino acid/amide ABC transporter ATP-binding protein 2, HAAT family [Paraburkholderia fungorum]|uniref:Amino acid/amide ABC transporter ATP-binding protein 2, HAAT family n=1 Tax=Paraburkholderia fungorum TaxID=134537 RepID=A0A1H1JBZ0_9BURK|nr:ATP-binding cassette domain-containing protein [Paraburkholderia fungorum]SDR47497.1 amino acid/amide ABC transporter ATP-binding protein 2, HAAT family [Paraburkholderia fungorum]